MTKPPTYDRDVGKNWHLRFRLIIQELTEELELTQIQLEIAERKLKKYEDNNTRSTRNRKNIPRKKNCKKVKLIIFISNFSNFTPPSTINLESKLTPLGVVNVVLIVQYSLDLKDSIAISASTIKRRHTD